MTAVIAILAILALGYVAVSVGREIASDALAEGLARAAERADEALASDFDGHCDTTLAGVEDAGTPIYDRMITEADWELWYLEMGWADS